MDFETSLIMFKEALINKLKSSSRVFIAPHCGMDFDAMGAAAGMCELARFNAKESYIVTDDNELMMNPNLKIMYDKLKTRYSFINGEQLHQICQQMDDTNDILIVVDTCKKYRIPAIGKELSNFKNIFILDHHFPGEGLIETDNAVITDEASSACEIVYKMLKLFGVTIDNYLAQCLLAGIYLDTQQFDLEKFTDTVSSIVTELLGLGASRAELKRLFTITNFESDRKQQRLVSELIDNTVFEMYNINVAITMNNKDCQTLYTNEALAQAADYLLKYAVDAVFVIGFIDHSSLGENHEDVVAIKARSKTHKDEDNELFIANRHEHHAMIDVNNIMEKLGGGGSKTSAATLIKTSDIHAVYEALKTILTPDCLTISKEQIEKVYTLLAGSINE